MEPPKMLSITTLGTLENHQRGPFLDPLGGLGTWCSDLVSFAKQLQMRLESAEGGGGVNSIGVYRCI